MPKDFKLYYAAQGNLEEVQRILDLGDVNINMEYYSGETPLYAASVMGNLPVVKLLLERGALINKADYNGYTPLYWASHFEHAADAPTFVEPTPISWKEYKSKKHY